jgi:hypothetical protein
MILGRGIFPWKFNRLSPQFISVARRFRWVAWLAPVGLNLTRVQFKYRQKTVQLRPPATRPGQTRRNHELQYSFKNLQRRCDVMVICGCGVGSDEIESSLSRDCEVTYRGRKETEIYYYCHSQARQSSVSLLGPPAPVCPYTAKPLLLAATLNCRKKG